MRAFRCLLTAALLVAGTQGAFAQNKIPSPAEIAKMAEAETDKEFGQDYKEKVRKEAFDRFPDIKPGDKITVQLRAGAGYTARTGILKSVGDDEIYVNFSEARDRKILRSEIAPDIYAGIYGENTALRANYIQKNYVNARANFKKAAADRLFQENGYFFDSGKMRWTPKSKLDLQPEEMAGAEEPAGQLFTTNGEVYYDVVTQHVGDDNIEITHSKGIAVIKLSKLTEQSRKRYAPNWLPPGKEKSAAEPAENGQ